MSAPQVNPEEIIHTSIDKQRKFRVRFNEESKKREILYLGDSFWQECEAGRE